MIGNNATSYLKRAIAFVAILIVLDQLIGHLLKYYYLKHEPQVSMNTEYVVNKCNQDILIIGSSHAQRNYIPAQIAAKTKMSCFDTGESGYYMLYSYGLLKSVLKRYSPKLIILDIRPDEFDTSPGSYDRLSVFAPLYADHPELKEIIYQRSRTERIKLLSVSYQFNSELLNIVSRNIHKNPNEYKVPENSGFVPSNNTFKGPIVKSNFYAIKNRDPNFINAFRSFIQLCKQHHVKLCVFISPVLPKVKPDFESMVIAKQIANRYSVPFFNYANSAVFKQNRLYFRDEDHLNTVGATAYTDSVISKISSMLN